MIMCGTQVVSAYASYGELGGSPIVETGHVSESSQRPHAFGVDPTDDSFYVADEVVQGETPLYRVQKFSASGTPLAEIKLKAKEASVDLGNRALEGIAVDPAAKRAYLLVDREREPEEETEVFDPSMAAAGSLYAFSTEVKNGEGKLEPASGTKNEEGLLVELHSESKEPRVALLEPHGIAVDATNGEVVILGQEDMDEEPALEPELRTAFERVRATGTIGQRYLDLENCLDGGVSPAGEAACEVQAQPFSPIVVPGGNGASEGKLYAERNREIWALPASTTEFKTTVKSKSEAKTFETHPTRVLPTELKEELGSEQALLEYPKAAEGLSEELGDTMVFVPGAASGEGKLYLTAALTTKVEKGTVTNAGALVLGYSEHAGAAAITELGWTGGQSESSGEKCALPKKGNLALLIGSGQNEDLFIFDAHEKLGTSSPGVDIFGFGSGGGGCPSASVSSPSVKVKNNQNEEVEVSPVPLGEPTTLSSTLTEGNAMKVTWKFKDLTTGEEEAPAEETAYEFQTTSLKHKFEHAGEYEVTEIVETDNLASPTVEIERKVTVGATPIGVEFSYPAAITVGASTRFEAAVHDPHEPGTPHLKYIWKFGDGEEHSGVSTAAEFAEEHTYRTEGTMSVTLKVTDEHGVSAEVTREISVAGVTKGPEGGGPKTGGGETTKTPPPPPPPSETAPTVTLAANSVSVSAAGAIPLQVKCPTGDSSCSGTVTLRTAGAIAAKHGKGKHKSVLTLASGSFTVVGGKVQTITLHLSPQGRTLLARLHVLRVQATIVAHNPGGATQTTQATLTLRAASKHKARHKH
jgi:PKD repeat protein